MIKSFDTNRYTILTSVVEAIETSLRCPKYAQMADRIHISLPEDVVFRNSENKELAEKGFGVCLTKSYSDDYWDVFIIINLRNCIRASLTEREIGAVILHELGHLLNEPELQDAPTFEFCFINGVPFSTDALENVRESNSLAMEIYADSYTNKHGYGKELISTFHKQNEFFEQKIGFCELRIENILRGGYFKGRTAMSKRY